jgi:hypothetical protein
MFDFTVEELLDNGISFNLANKYNSEDERAKAEAKVAVMDHFLFDIMNLFSFEDTMNEEWAKIDKILKESDIVKLVESKFPGLTHPDFLLYFVILRNALEFADQVYYYEKDEVSLAFSPHEIRSIKDSELRYYIQTFFLQYIDILQQQKENEGK